MDASRLDYKCDSVELAYLKFMEFEKEYHKAFSKDKILIKSANPYAIKRFNFLWIPYKESDDKIFVSALYVLKSLFIVELNKLIKDTKTLKKYSEIFDSLYINNKKWPLYSYQLEFYISFILKWMDVNFYVLPDSIHLLNDWEVFWVTGIFGDMGTHITVSLSELVKKTFNTDFKSKYTKTLTTNEELKILYEISEKHPHYKKKQIKINFNPDETLKDLDLDARAPVNMYHKIDKRLDFGKITKVKHNSKATHLELKKKISLKKDE